MRERSPAAAGSAGLSPKPRSLRVIVADDDRDTVWTLMTVLRHEGHEVKGLHRGGDVLPAIKDFGPDAVILDIAMPEMSGFQIADRINQRAKKPLLIAISGVFTKGSDAILSKLVGFDHHLRKPYEPSDVLKLLEPLRYPQHTD